MGDGGGRFAAFSRVLGDDLVLGLGLGIVCGELDWFDDRSVAAKEAKGVDE